MNDCRAARAIREPFSRAIVQNNGPLRPGYFVLPGRCPTGGSRGVALLIPFLFLVLPILLSGLAMHVCVIMTFKEKK